MAPTIAPDVAPLFQAERSVAIPRKTNTMTMMIGLLVLFLILVGMSRAFLKPKETSNVMRVVGAADDVPPGYRLGFSSVHYLELPKSYFTPDMLLSSNQVIGRVTRQFIAKGEPITNAQLFPGTNGLSLSFETNERAISFKLDDDALVDHSISPGDHVDILVTMIKQGKRYTKTIAQSVQVLMAMSKEARASNQVKSGDQNRITFAVTPDQTELLTEAMETGKVRLVLRNRLSVIQMKLSGKDESDLLPAKALISETAGSTPPKSTIHEKSLALAVAPPAGLNIPLPPSIEAPLEWIVEMFSGNKRKSYAFPKHSN